MNLIPAGFGFKCPDDPGEPGLGVPRWSVATMEGRILSEFFRGKTVLEIGTGLGVSTRAIASTAKEVYTVDIDPWVKENVVLPENVHFSTSLEGVPEVDAAFIDGLHSHKQCCIDIYNARRLVKDGGLIVLHDAHMKPIRGAINDSNFSCYEIATEAGLAFGWNEKETK